MVLRISFCFPSSYLVKITQRTVFPKCGCVLPLPFSRYIPTNITMHREEVSSTDIRIVGKYVRVVDLVRELRPYVNQAHMWKNINLNFFLCMVIVGIQLLNCPLLDPLKNIFFKFQGGLDFFFLVSSFIKPVQLCLSNERHCLLQISRGPRSSGRYSHTAERQHVIVDGLPWGESKSSSTWWHQGVQR